MLFTPLGIWWCHPQSSRMTWQFVTNSEHRLVLRLALKSSSSRFPSFSSFSFRLTTSSIVCFGIFGLLRPLRHPDGRRSVENSLGCAKCITVILYVLFFFAERLYQPNIKNVAQLRLQVRRFCRLLRAPIIRSQETSREAGILERVDIRDRSFSYPHNDSPSQARLSREADRVVFNQPYDVATCRLGKHGFASNPSLELGILISTYLIQQLHLHSRHEAIPRTRLHCFHIDLNLLSSLGNGLGSESTDCGEVNKLPGE